MLIYIDILIISTNSASVEHSQKNRECNPLLLDDVQKLSLTKGLASC